MVKWAVREQGWNLRSIPAGSETLMVTRETAFLCWWIFNFFRGHWWLNQAGLLLGPRFPMTEPSLQHLEMESEATHVFQALPGRPKPARPLLSFLFSACCSLGWFPSSFDMFSVRWICESRLPAIIGQLGLPGWNSWNSPSIIASIEVVILLLFTKYVNMCACEHTWMCAHVCACMLIFISTSVATQDTGFSKVLVMI